jgi:hypothetical protein
MRVTAPLGRALGTLLLAAAATVITPAPASAQGPDIYPLAKVKPGQRGHGLTVFQGLEPQKFDFEVIGVIRNFLPSLDIVLVKSDDPKLAVSGFAQGMSGSPLYLDGKVMCAFSYGFRFNKVAMGGCTPLESMLAESRGNPRRGPDKSLLASADDWRRYAPLAQLAERPRTTGRPWLMGPALPAVAAASGPEQLTRAAVPLAVSGLTPRAFETARAVFSPLGLEPMQAGGKGDDQAGPTEFVMGGSIGVQMMKGDASAVATGTVSWIDGHDILAFGHPMFQSGETYMPVTAAEVHYVVPSAQSAFKLSSPLRTLGSLVSDRQSHIEVDTSLRVGMIPVDLVVVRGKQTTTFHTEVVRHRFLTPQLVTMALGNGVQLVMPDVTDAVTTVESTVYLRGEQPITFVDYNYAADGAASAVASARALRILGPLLLNPWAPVVIERLQVKVQVAYGREAANILELRAPGGAVPYGKPFEVEVVLQPIYGAPYVERIPITLPEKLAGQVVKLEIVPGDSARLDVANPENLPQLIAALRRTYPGNVLVATVTSADDGIALGGVQLPTLPDSAIDSVRLAASTRAGELYKILVRSAVPTRRVLEGRAEITLHVQERRR